MVVVLLLNEPILLIMMVLLLEFALYRVPLVLGFLAGQELIDLEVAPLTFGFCTGGPLVRESARMHAKLECAGETDLPHVVSESFSKPGKLLEAGRSSRCVPLCGQRVGAKFCEPELQNALVHMHGDPLRRRRGRGGAHAVRPAQRAELGVCACCAACTARWR